VKPPPKKSPFCIWVVEESEQDGEWTPKVTGCITEKNAVRARISRIAFGRPTNRYRVAKYERVKP
jgi:hypothetical protein